MDFYYENHNGQIIPFYNSEYVLTEHTFTDWALSYTTVQKKSSGFSFEPATRDFIVRLMPREVEADDRKEAFVSLYNAFISCIAKDTDKPGKLWTTNGEYLVCRIVTSSKSKWIKYQDTTIQCTLLSDNPVWIKDRTYEETQRDETDNSGFLDYDYDYAYDYSNGQSGSVEIVNNGYSSADYRLIIYGPCADPYIVIDENVIGVSAILGDGDYLVIDSRTSEVYTVQNNGTIINQFNNRNKEYPIFDKVEPGRHTLFWNGTFGFNITIYEERREPEWS